MLYQSLRILPEVSLAFAKNQPVIALESTILTHGLPYPQSFELLEELETLAKDNGAIPATISVIKGQGVIGLSKEDRLYLKSLLMGESGETTHKLSTRELPFAMVKGFTGGTTVSATLKLAQLAGIKVFATGGIGGVHRGWQQRPDISMDLGALASIPMIVVSAGCKAILDIPATLEALESLAVPVLGYNTEEYPSFYSRQSGQRVLAASAPEIAKAYHQMRALGYNQGILVANPIPAKSEIPFEKIQAKIEEAIEMAASAGIRGKELTPYLLDALAQITGGESIRANLALIKNNLLVAIEIARNLG
ncbi:MAG: pseudouridine-5'-phosphate glycosidase [Candidatus Cloacimonadaceae bacterium]